ncbi:hypothetical protein RRG08_045236 [Elysia crispata]|uniref:Uncharacterized protein n=1 Tax=Elysia crispata TaxID=231223 RepID=A0AAE1DRD3_9GAST|nr:hypothetical protein RRG08_045236 [Elysia crispata]
MELVAGAFPPSAVHWVRSPDIFNILGIRACNQRARRDKILSLAVLWTFFIGVGTTDETAAYEPVEIRMRKALRSKLLDH